MDATGIYQMCAFLFVKAVKIWDVLEVVRIKITALYNFVWLYIIIKYSNLQIIAFFFKDWLCLLQDLRMRCLGSCHCDGLVIIIICKYYSCAYGTKYKCSCKSCCD